MTVMSLVHAHGALPDYFVRDHLQGQDRQKVEHACRVVHELGLMRHVNSRETFWDMDHRKPIWNGGSNEISNLRTLCIPCHREATRVGAKLRSQRRQS
jgi:5-methylcytosine-specific restriction endonuclease McrA